MKVRGGAVTHLKKDLTGQAMLEFALVLPVLLMILMGIIAFGHLFFSYMVLVSASREAARFGSAVGLTERYVPNYRDCAEIRANAARVGSMVGIEPNATNIQIEYDQGPTADGSPSTYPDGCPDTDGAVGPGYINLGDRIVVTTTVMYEPIVPLVDIPPFPLTSVTRRTIVIDMPVGDVPVAVPVTSCIETLTRIIPPDWATEGELGSDSLIGEPVYFDVQAISNSPTDPAQGTLYLYINDSLYTDATAFCSGTAPLYHCTAPATFNTIGDHTIRARFAPSASASPCFLPSRAEPVTHHVDPAETVTTITSHHPNPSRVGAPILVEVEVAPVSPGGGIPDGTVTVYEGANRTNHCSITLAESASTPGAAAGSCSLTMTSLGEANWLLAIYDEPETFDPQGTHSPNYKSSQARVFHAVREVVNASDSNCPVFSPIESGSYAGSKIDFSVNSRMILCLNNTASDFEGSISEIVIYWPGVDPQVTLLSFMLDSQAIWTSGSTVYSPPMQRFSSTTTTGWNDGTAVVGANVTKQLSIAFSGDPIGGNFYPYTVVVNFESSDPSVDCDPISASGWK